MKQKKVIDKVAFTESNSLLKELTGEIVLYQPDETIRLEVRMEDETVWLNQQQMVTLFQSSKANISEHISLMVRYLMPMYRLST